MPGPADAEAAAQNADLARIDQALIGLRRLWSTPPKIEDQALGSVDMSTIWIVDALIRADDQGQRQELTIRDLATALDVAQSTASRLVDRAEASGAVARHASGADARMVAVQLTGLGRDLARTASEFRQQHLQQATAGWTDRERATFADLLARFAHTVGPTDPRH